MKFGIITPVFDGCFESIKLLYENLQSQTFDNWIWLLCSNSYSEKYAEFVKTKNAQLKQPKLVYVCTNECDPKNHFSLIANIGKRRNLCIKRVNCDYVGMIDADAKIIDNTMFETLIQEIRTMPKQVILYRIKIDDGTLPQFPISIGKIDLLNFFVKTELAKRIGYPSTVGFYQSPNDFNFFVKAYNKSKGEVLFLSKIFCEYNGNNCYKNIGKILLEQKKQPKQKDYIKYCLSYLLYCLNERYLIGLLKVAHDSLFYYHILPKRIIAQRNVYFKKPILKTKERKS
ncbi:MAG: hypothetical protein ACFCUE_11850 [Candidatus Bathyarchaeia archaeon]|jgi:hypothetical protein